MDEHGVRTGLRVSFCPSQRFLVSPAGDHRNADRLDHVPLNLQLLSRGDEAGVTHAFEAAGNTEPACPNRVESGLLDQLRAEGIVSSDGLDDAGTLEQDSQFACVVHIRALCESADWLSMKTFAVQRNPELVSRASKIGVGSHAFFELRCQGAACKKDDATVSLHIVRQVDLGFWTEPGELLKEPACDLSGSQIKRSELRLQVFQDQLVRFYALIANDGPGELSVNRDEP